MGVPPRTGFGWDYTTLSGRRIWMKAPPECGVRRATQLIITGLIKVTGNPVVPAWYWTAAAVVGIAAICATRKSAPRKTSGLNTCVAGKAEVR